MKYLKTVEKIEPNHHRPSYLIVKFTDGTEVYISNQLIEPLPDLLKSPRFTIKNTAKAADDSKFVQSLSRDEDIVFIESNGETFMTDYSALRKIALVARDYKPSFAPMSNCSSCGG